MQRDLPRHFTAYTITAIVYICVVIAIYYSQTRHFVSTNERKEKVIQMSLSTFVPEVVTPVKKEIFQAVEEVQKPVIEKIAQPVEPMVQKPVVEPKPVVKKPVLKPKPVVKKPVTRSMKKKSKVKKKIAKKTIKKKTKKSMKKKVSKREAFSKQKKSSSGQRNLFFNRLRTKIDKYKFYPRIAQKRRMEGSVKVRFTIMPSGKVGNISVSGSKVFYRSAKNAVKSAFPISIKNIPISLPYTVNLTLHYRIR